MDKDIDLTIENIDEILNLMEYANNEYYNNDNSIISDLDYDNIKDFVKNNIDKLQVETKKRAEKLISKIGAKPNSRWKKEKHEVPMVSLEKVNSEEDFLKWENGIRDDLYLIMDKVDGISISLKYKNGRLINAITRGENNIGEEILRNVLMMKNIKKGIEYKEDLEIRGEIVLLSEDFEEINKIIEEEGERVFKTQRNAASGIAKRFDGKYSEFLTVLHYNTTKHFDTELEKMSFIQDILGLKTCFWKVGSKDMVIKIFDKFDKEIRERMRYQIDGMVIRHNNESLNPGTWSNGNPKGSIAWKFPPIIKITEILDINWQVGMSGLITPVGRVSPIKIDGATIENVSLANLSKFYDLNLQVGCKVYIFRANDVIPHISGRVSGNDGGEFFYHPKNCPICGMQTDIDGKFLICNNTNCKGTKLGNLKKWIDTLDIKGIGEETIEQLYDNGLLKDPSDFYILDSKEVIKLDRMGEKKVSNIINGINEKKSVNLETFIAGLNIKSISSSIIENLKENGFDSIEKIKTANTMDLCKIHGIEQKTAIRIIEGINRKLDVIDKLLKNGIEIKNEEKVKIDGALSGKSFCFTGAINKVDNNGNRYTRNMLHEIVINNGGLVEDSIKKDLTYLVQADINSVSSKSEKAKRAGVNIISEEEFFNMI